MKNQTRTFITVLSIFLMHFAQGQVEKSQFSVDVLLPGISYEHGLTCQYHH